MLKKRKNTGSHMTFFLHYLITIILLISPTASYSEQEARAEKITATTKSTASFSHSTVLRYHVQVPMESNIWDNDPLSIQLEKNRILQHPADCRRKQSYC
jgi:hypothetical protein